jgi:3',5'-cyclic AMP phosphodiesterase CpdA
VLIHAGDLTNQGSYTELKKTMEWLEKQDFEAKIVIAGMRMMKQRGPWMMT